MKFSRPFVLASFLAVSCIFFVAVSPSLNIQLGASQAPASQPLAPLWQVDAGGQAKFDVASVKQNKSGPPPSGDKPNSNVPFSPGDTYAPSGGLFSATNYPLFSYIAFAYKLSGSQFKDLLDHLPKWAATDRFDIQAKSARPNPTKDQMRLMVQSLLADRFKLAIHYETQQRPILGLALIKPGKTGSQLRPHSDATPCPVPTLAQASVSAPAETVAGGFPVICGSLMPLATTPGRLRAGSRDVNMQQIVTFLNTITGLDRPIVDQTGLTGKFDFFIEFTPQLPPSPNNSTFQPDESGSTFLEALKDQLGLKLDSQTGPVDVLVVDHVEEPRPN
jgi:uncharacterized protein (TIGR03435 family)